MARQSDRVLIYDKDGNSILVLPVDGKESVATGRYSWEPPGQAKKEIKEVIKEKVEKPKVERIKDNAIFEAVPNEILDAPKNISNGVKPSKRNFRGRK